MPGYKEDVAAIARAACQTYAAGGQTYRMNGVVFDLVTGGWCGRFVRQCCAAAARNVDPDFDEFGFSWLRRYASQACLALAEMGYRTEHPQPGDIVGMSPGYRAPGHIGIYLGSQVAENTSSTVRGPGTVLSPIAAVRHLITGYYAVFPARSTAPAETSLMVVGLDGRPIDCHPAESRGTTRVDLRPIVEALGYACAYKLHEDGRRRVYLTSRGQAVG
jgi:hypothetical protein